MKSFQHPADEMIVDDALIPRDTGGGNPLPAGSSKWTRPTSWTATLGDAKDHDGSSVPATPRNVNRSRSEEFWRGTSRASFGGGVQAALGHGVAD